MGEILSVLVVVAVYLYFAIPRPFKIHPDDICLCERATGCGEKRYLFREGYPGKATTYFHCTSCGKFPFYARKYYGGGADYFTKVRQDNAGELGFRITRDAEPSERGRPG